MSEKGDRIDAVEVFEQAFGDLKLVEAEWQAYIREMDLPPFREALLKLRLREFAEAEPLLRRHLQDYPGHPRGHYALGDALLFQGRHDEAVASFQRAIELAPGNVKVYRLLPAALGMIGRPEEALAVAERGVELAPDDLRYQALAVYAKAAGEQERAREAIQRAIALAGALPHRAELEAM